ncbi:rhodanese-like domain-containing protein [Clostridium transplantifaecale]|uniref:rhodanese-like domain-containing protein n=1 Tax=Clostridium transplantifaecale TaxID=2479838 RepID=UPI000F63C366|nr:rhodanese-like domain-containing protein [Clostridium transplantifaecale]
MKKSTWIGLGIGVLLVMGLAGCARAKAGTTTQAQMETGMTAGMETETEEPMGEQENTQMEPQTEEAAYHKISAAEAKEMMDQTEVTVVDVRTLQEYKEGHVPGAINIPNEEIQDTEPELLNDKDAMLLVYCRSGRRSKDASDKLVKMGYKNVYDFGGIIDWNYDTEK